MAVRSHVRRMVSYSRLDRSEQLVSSVSKAFAENEQGQHYTLGHCQCILLSITSIIPWSLENFCTFPWWRNLLQSLHPSIRHSIIPTFHHSIMPSFIRNRYHGNVITIELTIETTNYKQSNSNSNSDSSGGGSSRLMVALSMRRSSEDPLKSNQENLDWDFLLLPNRNAIAICSKCELLI